MDTDLLSDKLELPLQLDRRTGKRLKAFITGLIQRQEKSYASFTVPLGSLDPLSLLQKNWSDQAFQYYWEKPAKKFAIAAGNELIRLYAAGSNRFTDIHQQKQAVLDAAASFSSVHHSYSGLMFLGGFSFFNEFSDADWNTFEPASLTVPKWLILQDGNRYSVTIAMDIRFYRHPEDLYEEVMHRLHNLDQLISTCPGQKKQHFSRPPVCKTGESIPASNYNSDYDAWISSVQKAKEEIQKKTFKKIVLARKLSVSRNRTAGPASVLNQLRHQYQNCSCFLIHPANGNSFLGATPEQLVAFQHDVLRTEALAGSMERGATIMEDTDLERDLSFSAKNRMEHQFVVRDIEQRLRPFAHTIHHSSPPQVKKLSNVQHLYTPIQANLKPETTVLSILENLHPTPAVGGYPWGKAAPHIRKLEHFERGWYAGPVGWLNASGGGEFAVAIRSGLLDKEKAHFFAGCGIVADSDPQAEWEETNLKLKPMLSALRYDE